jgi:hypothetical protein
LLQKFSLLIAGHFVRDPLNKLEPKKRAMKLAKQGRYLHSFFVANTINDDKIKLITLRGIFNTLVCVNPEKTEKAIQLVNSMDDDDQKLRLLNNIVLTLVQFYPEQMDKALQLTQDTSLNAHKNTLQGSIFFSQMFFHPDQINNVLQLVSTMNETDKKIILKDIFSQLVPHRKQTVIALEYAKLMNQNDQEIILDELLTNHHSSQIERTLQLANILNLQSKIDKKLETIVHKIIVYDSTLREYCNAPG